MVLSREERGVLYKRWSLETSLHGSHLSRHLKDGEEGGAVQAAGTHCGEASKWEAGWLGDNELWTEWA